MTTDPYTVTALTYAGRHLDRAIESLEAGDVPELLGAAMGIRQAIENRLAELQQRLRPTGGHRQAAALYGPTRATMAQERQSLPDPSTDKGQAPIVDPGASGGVPGLTESQIWGDGQDGRAWWVR